MEEVEKLREREKELRCLYEVQRLTLAPDLSLEAVLQSVVDTLGKGWQRPDSTGARIEYFGRFYSSDNFDAQAPSLMETLRMGNQIIGAVVVSDSFGKASEVAKVFLDEERTLLTSIAGMISSFVEWRHLEVLGKRFSSTRNAHWQWRESIATGLVRKFDEQKFGPTEFYLGGSTQRGDATHGSDIDLFVYHRGSQAERGRLAAWLDGWSHSVSEVVRIQTGEVLNHGILSVRWLDERPDMTRYPQYQLLGSSVTNSPESNESHGDNLEGMLQRTLMGISHEFRTPLTIISTDLNLLRQEPPEEMRCEVLAEAEQAVSRMSTLISDLLLFLRAETGLEKPTLEEVEVGEFVSGVVSRMEEKERSGRLSQVLKEPREPLYAHLNRRITKRIISDLVMNALRYSQSEQVIVSVLADEMGMVVITVKDDGCGIEESHHEKLFEQFYRLESSRDRNTGGVGLGLPLARALSRCQNGTLDFVSRPGVGTEVRLSFRRTQGPLKSVPS